MTDVIDDTLTWEQRREIRRKKRQELLAEADRIVKTSDQVSSQKSYVQTGDNDSFEQDRQRRRKEREEKRKKEREELEKQLRDEDDARAEREKRREERRRQREEADVAISKYSTKESQQEEKKEVEEVVAEEPEKTESEYSNQDGSEGVDSTSKQDGSDDGNGDIEQEQDGVEEAVSTKNNEEVDQSQILDEISSQIREDEDESESLELNGETKEGEVIAEAEKSHDSQAVELSEDNQQPSAAELLEERKERRHLEEEQQEREETERKKAENEERQRREKEERKKRMTESEARRKQLTKQTSAEAKELTAKGNATTAVLMKMKDLNERISESPKTHKEKPDTVVAKLSSLDDRLKNYRSKAERQDSAKKSSTPRTGRSDVANRLNMWETGKVATPEKMSKKVSDTGVVKQSAGVSSRKNLWETGKVASSSEKKTTRTEIHGANFASRKNMWLKATQETSKTGGKLDGTQVIKTGVTSRRDKWEKGEVTGSTATSKQKTSHLPASDVNNRRSKWENISHDTQSQLPKKAQTVHAFITTEVSSRKTMYESKAQGKDLQARKNSADVEEEEAVKPVGRSVAKPRRRDSLSSGMSDDDDQVLSDDSDQDQSGQQLELDSADSDKD